MAKADAVTPTLQDGSRVAVVGGGPAGSFFSYFLLELAERVGINLKLDIYEPRDFVTPGPAGCNMCGGIVSESLVQSLATEGIHIPPEVVQRSIDSYFLHMDIGNVRIETPLREMRIAAVHRGSGPRGICEVKCPGGLDGYLLRLAIERGARHVRKRIEGCQWQDGKPQLKPQGADPQPYDLVAPCVGINSPALKMFAREGHGYQPPKASKTYICEFLFGRDMIRRDLGSAMHVFLLNIPRLEFAALIPKRDYVTLCLLGHDIDKQLVQQFLDSPEVKECLPANWTPPPDFCHCSPAINVDSAVQPFAERMVFIGDCGTARLYKDGIGSAYRTAKAAAKTCVFHGIGAENFRQHYWPVCQAICTDNLLGKFVFGVTRQIQQQGFARRALWRMVSKEQKLQGGHRRMSMVLWDTFTGSAPYRHVLLRTFHPAFIGRFAWELAAALWPSRNVTA